MIKFNSIDNKICTLLAIININEDEYILYEHEDIIYASYPSFQKIEDKETYDTILNIISKYKNMKPKFINYGYIDNNGQKLKVIFDLKEEKRYFYKLEKKYIETTSQELEELYNNNDFITKKIDNSYIRIYKKLPDEFSRNYLEITKVSEKDTFDGIPKYDFKAFNNGIIEQIDEESKKEKDEDYKSTLFINERNYIKLLMEILGPSILLETYTTQNDKLLIEELENYLTLEESYNLIRLINECDIEADILIKKIYQKKYNAPMENDQICMSYIDAIRNTNQAGFKFENEVTKIEVDKFYISEQLKSEYAYITHYFLEGVEKLTILHDMNRKTNQFRRK